MTLSIGTTPIGEIPTPTLDELVRRRGFRMDPDLAEAFVAEDRASQRLAQLLDGALCVTTGQQPGLFTGPLFSVYKGLSAVVLAEALERRLGRPVVPVYWVAGDDHDLAEANHVHLLTVANEIDRLVTHERAPDAPLTPLYRERLGVGVAAALDRVRAETPATEFQPHVMEWLERHYRPEVDFATAFAGAIAELLGPMGLVVFRPTHEGAKRAMAPLLLRALEQAGPLHDALAATAARLEQEGRPAPVPVGDGATLVMCECERGRDRLIRESDGFHARRSGNRWTLDDLRRIAADQPERLSPNVLLRPVVEAQLLPTLMYVAGPGELAYFPQTAPAYEALGVVPQLPVPRWSGSVIEARVLKVLEKYGIGPEDLGRPEGQLEAELVRDDMPSEGAAALRALRQALDREYGRLETVAVELDPTLRKTVQHARNSSLRDVAELEKKLIAHLKKHNEIVVQQIAKARINLVPLGKPQERVFTVAPYLIRYGRAFLDAVVSQAREYYRPLESA